MFEKETIIHNKPYATYRLYNPLLTWAIDRPWRVIPATEPGSRSTLLDYKMQNKAKFIQPDHEKRNEPKIYLVAPSSDSLRVAFTKRTVRQVKLVQSSRS